MQSSKIKYKGEIIARICLCTDYGPATDKNGLILSLLKDIKNLTVNYDWIIKRRELYKWLTGMIFDQNVHDVTIPQFHFDTEKILKIIRRSIISCSN